MSAEIKELFQCITDFKPHDIELEIKMMPFIPDYIPAVGEPHPFVKVARPDSKHDNLGLATLDEPAAQQCDPSVLNLQLCAARQMSGAQPAGEVESDVESVAIGVYARVAITIMPTDEGASGHRSASHPLINFVVTICCRCDNDDGLPQHEALQEAVEPALVQNLPWDEEVVVSDAYSVELMEVVTTPRRRRVRP